MQRFFRKLPASFPHPFLTQYNVFFAIFCEFSADFPQKKPFANDPISELLPIREASPNSTPGLILYVRPVGSLHNLSMLGRLTVPEALQGIEENRKIQIGVAPLEPHSNVENLSVSYRLENPPRGVFESLGLHILELVDSFSTLTGQLNRKR